MPHYYLLKSNGEWQTDIYELNYEILLPFFIWEVS